jgi:hypothetical protein
MDWTNSNERSMQLHKKIDEAHRQQAEETAKLAALRAQIEEMNGLASQCSSLVEGLDEATRIQYQDWAVQLQRSKDAVESNSALLKDSMSTTEVYVREIAEAKESLARVRSERETVIESVVQEALSAHSEAIVSARTALTTHDADVKAEVANMVGRNNDRASIKDSNAVHACAANMTPDYIDLLLEFVPDAVEQRLVLNKRDAGGLTPLMAAVVSPHSSSSKSMARNARFQMAEKLIHLGADKNITDAATGETALGKYRRMKRSMSDFRNMIGMQHNHSRTDVDLESRLEELLRPVGGPTAADDAYLDDNNSNNSDDDENDNDDDGSEFQSVDGGDDEDQMDEEEEVAD